MFYGRGHVLPGISPRGRTGALVWRRSRPLPATPLGPTTSPLPPRVAAPLPGLVVMVAVVVGDAVRKGQKLLTMEAMKMETSVRAEADGTVAEVLVKPGMQVDAKDLLVVLT